MMHEHHLLVTTTHAAWILDLESGLARLLDQGRGVYYGISFSDDRLFIACRRAPVGADRDRQANVILCFDRALQPAGVLQGPVPIRDVHQVLYAAGTLFICSTYDDAVLCYEPGTGRWQVWHPFGPGTAQDHHHINSVATHDGDILLAGNRPHGWHARFTANRHLVGREALGAGTHNVWSEGGDIGVCSSDEGAVRTAGGQRRPVVAQGWLRGVARGRKMRYFGVSQNLVRGIRDRSDCMILALDEEGSITRTFSFLGYGMLHDIRVLGHADDTHNGVAFRLGERWTSALGDAYQTSSQPIDLQPRDDADLPR